MVQQYCYGTISSGFQRKQGDPRRRTGVGKVVLLDAHLAAGDDVGDDVLLRRVLVDAVRVLGHRHHLATLLVHGAVSRLRSIPFRGFSFITCSKNVRFQFLSLDDSTTRVRRFYVCR